MDARARVWSRLGLMALPFVAAGPAYGQVEHGRVLGTVKDAQGGVLPGVTVTATSAALIGQRTAVTEADGRYLLTKLPSGTYTLKGAEITAMLDLYNFTNSNAVTNFFLTSGTTYDEI